ncbi:MAG: hypothetical protein Q9202_000899 [Teloschistes flavicans]
MFPSIIFWGAYLVLFWDFAYCAPFNLSTPSLPIFACSNLLPNLRPLIKDTNLNGIPSLATNHSAQVSINHGKWYISDTLSLDVTICNWEPDPATILAVLAAAELAIGKKPAGGLLQEKFTQKSNNKFNTLLFEITPGFIEKLLTWGDVGEVLGEHGLRDFFETTHNWHTIYFDVTHATRGKLGYGAVRRWWQ